MNRKKLFLALIVLVVLGIIVFLFLRNNVVVDQPNSSLFQQKSCTELDEQQCNQNQSCRPVYGVKVCNGDSCIVNDVFNTCRDISQKEKDFYLKDKQLCENTGGQFMVVREFSDWSCSCTIHGMTTTYDEFRLPKTGCEPGQKYIQTNFPRDVYSVANVIANKDSLNGKEIEIGGILMLRPYMCVDSRESGYCTYVLALYDTSFDYSISNSDILTPSIGLEKDEIDSHGLPVPYYYDSSLRNKPQFKLDSPYIVKGTLKSDSGHFYFVAKEFKLFLGRF